MITLDEDEIDLIVRCLPPKNQHDFFPPHVKKLVKKLEVAQKDLMNEDI